MTTKLADLLQAEIVQMDNRQRAQFKRELTKTIPQAVKMAAEAVKQAPETAPVGRMSENVREK